MTERWTSIDPRSAGRDEAVGSTIAFLSGGELTLLSHYDIGPTDWVAVTEPYFIVTDDPRVDGLDMRVGATVLYYPPGFSGPGDAVLLYHYGAGSTQWAPWATSDHVAGSISFTATDKLLGRSTSGAGAGEEIACTSAARSILDDATVADIRDTLGVEASRSQGRVAEWNTIANSSSAPTGIGMTAPTTTGTLTSRSVAATNMFTMVRRHAMVSSASAGSSAGYRTNLAVFGRGNATGAGGFTFVCRFGISDAAAVANARMFVGLIETVGALANAEPSTNVNMIGVGCEAGQTTMRTYSNDGTGTASMADLGSSFPTDTRTTDYYELHMFCAPNGSTITYKLTRLNTGDIATGSWSSDIPSATTLLGPVLWRNNGSTALAVGIDLATLTIRSDT